MSDKDEKTNPGSVDDDAKERIKDANEKKKKMLEDLDSAAWNRGRNSADPSRKKVGKVMRG
jgi:hypothetical protein